LIINTSARLQHIKPHVAHLAQPGLRFPTTVTVTALVNRTHLSHSRVTRFMSTVSCTFPIVRETQETYLSPWFYDKKTLDI